MLKVREGFFLQNRKASRRAKIFAVKMKEILFLSKLVFKTLQTWQNFIMQIPRKCARI